MIKNESENRLAAIEKKEAAESMLKVAITFKLE